MNGQSTKAPAIRIRIRWVASGLCLEYAGRPEALLLANAATAEMLTAGQRGVQRFDADGDLYALTKQYNTGRVVLSRWKSPAAAVCLPGVEAWLAGQPKRCASSRRI